MQAALKRKPANNPVKLARQEYTRYKEIYGNNMLLDQAVRVVTHWANCKTPTNTIEDQRVIEIYDQSEVVENASMMVAREDKTKSGRIKAQHIALIRSLLLDCLGTR